MSKLMVTVAAAVLGLAAFAEKTLWIDELPAEVFDQDNYPPAKNKSVMGEPLRIAKQAFKRGIGSHANAVGLYQFKGGKPISFEAFVGVDGYVLGKDNGDASLKFVVRADGKAVAESPVMKADTPAFHLKADIRGAKTVELVIDDLGNNSWDLADWCDARFTFEEGTEVVVYDGLTPQLGILTPKPGPAPRINGAKVFGVRPGHEILWKLPVSGERPMALSAANLPKGARFDAKTGILSGAVAERGTYPIAFTAKNAKGEATSTLKLVVGDRIALTPPMGWNSWNVFANKVTEKDIRDTVDVFAGTGLGEHGWSYVNIDDFWCNYQRKDAHPDIQGPMRRRDGTVVTNARFPDMKGLADYVHAKGLKVGLYSSPGPLTCGGCTGSWGYEAIDAATWAGWGFDYVKYDWCSYGDVAVAKDDPTLYFQAPYLKLGRELARQDRDIVYSLCQYGMDRVSRWGDKVGGQCWRTTHDIEDTWESMRFIASAQQGLERYAGPGAWNDPDMLIVGWVGWGPKLHPTRLTPNEQYTHMTLWSLFAAPLLIGCDLTKLDDFTRAILTNPEVLAVNQDPLGKAAARVGGDEPGFYEDIWARPLEDGSIAVGIVNLSYETRTIVVDLRGIGLVGEWKVRDLWRRIDEKPVRDVYKVTLPAHAPHFIRLTAGADGRLAPGVTDVRDAAWDVHFGPDRDTKATIADDCPLCPKGK